MELSGISLADSTSSVGTLIVSAVTISSFMFAVHRQPAIPSNPKRPSNHGPHFIHRTQLTEAPFIPGDGIAGKLFPEGVRVLESAAREFGFQLQLDEFDFASCDTTEVTTRCCRLLDGTDFAATIPSFFVSRRLAGRRSPTTSALGSAVQLFRYRREFDQSYPAAVG